jgi:hypothetical protein
MNWLVSTGCVVARRVRGAFSRIKMKMYKTGLFWFCFDCFDNKVIFRINLVSGKIKINWIQIQIYIFYNEFTTEHIVFRIHKMYIIIVTYVDILTQMQSHIPARSCARRAISYGNLVTLCLHTFAISTSGI